MAMLEVISAQADLDDALFERAKLGFVKLSLSGAAT